jgi:hypothetical protein
VVVSPLSSASAAGTGIMSRTLIRILADMLDVALDDRTLMRYASDHEEAVSDLQEDVRRQDDVAAVLQPGVQGERLQAPPQEGSG